MKSLSSNDQFASLVSFETGRAIVVSSSVKRSSMAMAICAAACTRHYTHYTRTVTMGSSSGMGFRE